MFFTCSLEGCEKQYNCKKALKEHERTHNTDRPFKCEKCDQTFTQYSSLQKHARVHDKQQPYKCNFEGCEQAFSQVSNLIRHKRIHTGEKPYVCSFCRKEFASGSNLKQHLQIHEEQEQRNSFKCIFEGCDKMYLYPSSLKKHYMMSHDNEYKHYLKEKQIETCGFHLKDDDIPYQLNDQKSNNLNQKIHAPRSSKLNRNPDSTLNPENRFDNSISQQLYKTEQGETSHASSLREQSLFRVGFTSFQNNDSQIHEHHSKINIKKRLAPMMNDKQIKDREELQGQIKRQKVNESQNQSAVQSSQNLEYLTHEFFNQKNANENQNQNRHSVLKQAYQQQIPKDFYPLSQILDQNLDTLAAFKQIQKSNLKILPIQQQDLLNLGRFEQINNSDNNRRPPSSIWSSGLQKLFKPSQSQDEDYSNSIEYQQSAQKSLIDLQQAIYQEKIQKANDIIKNSTFQDQQFIRQLAQLPIQKITPQIQIQNHNGNIKQEPKIANLIQNNLEVNSNNSVKSVSMFIKPSQDLYEKSKSSEGHQNSTKQQSRQSSFNTNNQNLSGQQFSHSAKKIVEILKPTPKLNDMNLRINSTQFENKASSLGLNLSFRVGSPDLRLPLNFNFNESNLKIARSIQQFNSEAVQNLGDEQQNRSIQKIKDKILESSLLLNQANEEFEDMINNKKLESSSPSKMLAFQSQLSNGAFQIVGPQQTSKFSTSLSLFSDISGNDLQQQQMPRKSQFFQQAYVQQSFPFRQKMKSKQDEMRSSEISYIINSSQQPQDRMPESNQERSVFNQYLQYTTGQNHAGISTENTSRHPSSEIDSNNNYKSQQEQPTQNNQQ